MSKAPASRRNPTAAKSSTVSMHVASRNSNVAGSTPPRTTPDTARPAAASVEKYARPSCVASGAGTRRTVSSVSTASVPSLPHSKRRMS